MRFMSTHAYLLSHSIMDTLSSARIPQAKLSDAKFNQQAPDLRAPKSASASNDPKYLTYGVTLDAIDVRPPSYQGRGTVPFTAQQRLGAPHVCRSAFCLPSPVLDVPQSERRVLPHNMRLPQPQLELRASCRAPSHPHEHE